VTLHHYCLAVSTAGIPLTSLDEDHPQKNETKLGVFACTSGCGAGHAHMSLVCEEACLLRLLLSYPRWHDVVLNSLVGSLQAANISVTSSCHQSNRTLLRCLASLIVISDYDMLRVGGVVDRVFQSGTERYTVVEYSRGSSKILAVDMYKGGNNTVTLPIATVFCGELVPLPEIETPKFRDSMAKLLLAELLNLAKACPRYNPLLHQHCSMRSYTSLADLLLC